MHNPMTACSHTRLLLQAALARELEAHKRTTTTSTTETQRRVGGACLTRHIYKLWHQKVYCWRPQSLRCMDNPALV